MSDTLSFSVNDRTDTHDTAMPDNVLSFAVEEKIKTEDGLAYDGPLHYRKNGSVYSVYPPTAYLTFGNWIYMVPPFKPKSVLMLGYAGGTVAGLIQLLYGSDVPITAVDTEIIDNRYNVELIKADARDFVRFAKPYECVILDIFNEQLTPDFVTDPVFVERVAQLVSDFLVIHASPDANIGIYEQHLTRLRLLDIGHKIYYFCRKDSLRHYFPPK